MRKIKNELIRLVLFNGDKTKVDEEATFLDLEDDELDKLQHELNAFVDEIEEIIRARRADDETFYSESRIDSSIHTINEETDNLLEDELISKDVHKARKEVLHDLKLIL